MSARIGEVRQPRGEYPVIVVNSSGAGVELHAESNVTLGPIDARNYAALLVRAADEVERMRARDAANGVPMEDLLRKPIDELRFSVRVIYALRSCGVECVGDLVRKSARDLTKNVPNFGRKSLREVQGALTAMGLRLTEVRAGRRSEP